MSGYFGKEVFKLGFGFMRLPRLEDGSTDLNQINEMVDRFIAGGGTYFDTAYVYGTNGDSETAIRDAVVKRYPRDAFTIATKLNVAKAADEEDAKKQFDISMERMECGYFDYYLLHAIQENNYETYEDWHLWDFVKQKKAEGLIRHIGFSFHASPELLDKLLTEHPEAEFVQLQINYADWDNPNVNSGQCYEVARSHGVSITVMEPLKGGALANPAPAVQEILNAADQKHSFASWGIRYVASLDGIITVLSGMSTLAQVEDNMSFMKNFRPLNEAEQEVIRKAQAALKEGHEIACTACQYCTPGCPMRIAIPKVFAAMNEYRRYHSPYQFNRNYGLAVKDGGSAADCIQCGQCEGVCPQHLPIISLLEEIQKEIDEYRKSIS